SLPNFRIEEGISIYHGSPMDPDEYVFEEMIDKRFVSLLNTDYTILGHTHIPFVRLIDGKTILNPGSTGQPRDGDPRASFAILEGDRISLRRVDYDIEAQIVENMKAGLPSAISERLRWGV
ncbi:MAG: metallophosphoesterase family protein, partial [Methanomassiliicoccales archaeon]